MAESTHGPVEGTMRARLLAALAAGLLVAVGLGFVVDTGRTELLIDEVASERVRASAAAAAADLGPLLPPTGAVDGVTGTGAVDQALLDRVATHLGLDAVAVVRGTAVVGRDDALGSMSPAAVRDRVGDGDTVAISGIDDEDAWLGVVAIDRRDADDDLLVVRDRPLGSLAASLMGVRLLTLGFVALTGIGFTMVAVRLLVRPLERLVARVRSGDRSGEDTATIERVDLGGGRFSIQFADPDQDGDTELGMVDELEVIEHVIGDLRRDLDAASRTIQRQQSALAEATRRVVAGQDETRRQLAGELHDGIQQQLVMLRLDLTLARSSIATDPGGEAEVFANLSSKVDAMLGRLRDTARGVYPAILRDRGLHEALTSLARQSHGRVRVAASPRPFPRLDLDIEANSYFLVAESVSNALKHAGEGARVSIDLVCDPDRLRVRVRDDGDGFDPGTAGGGRGLANLHDRATAMGGQLEIVSGRSGTTVLALLPLHGPLALPDPAVRRRRAGPNSVTALEVQQDGRDPAVQVDVVLDVELLEDRRDVLLDGPFDDVEFGPDSGVALAGGHEGQDLVLPRGEGGEAG